MSILPTFTLITVARKEVVETTKIARTIGTISLARAARAEEDSEYLRINLAQVLYIQYLIIF